MEIVRDEPGRALSLAETSPRLPFSGLAGAVGLILLIATPWPGLWRVLVHGAAWESPDWVGAGIYLFIGVGLLASALGGKRLERVTVDRDRDRVDWRTSHVAGLVGGGGHLALEALEGLILARATLGTTGSRKGRDVPLRLCLRAGRGREHALALRVAKINGNAEIADLALRLGAAAGLPYYRVVSSNDLQFEIALGRSAEPGVKAVPALGRAADYAHDAVVAAAAAAATEDKLPPFDPASFKGSPRVTVFDPGREVRFEKPWGPSILLAPLLAAIFLGPVAWWRLPALHAMPILPRLVALGLLTFAGIGLGLVGWFGLSSALPRRVVLDWTARTLAEDGLGRGRLTSFTEVKEIEIRTHSHRFRQGRNQYYMSYRCAVRAMLTAADAAGSGEVLLAETRYYREDPQTPYAMTLPLAAELASALGVERQPRGKLEPQAAPWAAAVMLASRPRR